MNNTRTAIAAAAALAAALTVASARADVSIGACISLTGPTSALGIPTGNGIELWPKAIAGEKLNVIILDDATDPAVAVKNTRRFITEDQVDVIVGSVATPVAAPMSDVAAEGQTVQLMLSPVNLPEGKGVTGQVLKLVSANPDAVLVVASGRGAAMPHKGLVERVYAKNKIDQTHGAASFDLIRVGGADVEGSYVVSGPAVVAGMPSQGVLNFTATDHFGYTPETGVMLTIANGEWKVVASK